jgi:hypothetical protein
MPSREGSRAPTERNSEAQPEGDDSQSVIEHYQRVCLVCLRDSMAYRLIPDSGKVIVFDSGLRVLHAFEALVNNGVNCAPVWDSQKRKYVGMLSATDFIDILLYCHQHQEKTDTVAAHPPRTADPRAGQVLASIQSQRICDWQDIKRGRLHIQRPAQHTPPTRPRHVHQPTPVHFARVFVVRVLAVPTLHTSRRLIYVCSAGF